MSFLRAYRIDGKVFTDTHWHEDALRNGIKTLALQTGRTRDEIADDIDNDVILAEHGFVIDGTYLPDSEYDELILQQRVA